MSAILLAHTNLQSGSFLQRYLHSIDAEDYYLRVPHYEVKPVTHNRWDDLVQLFGPGGASGGCWCMYPRIKGSEMNAKANKVKMKNIVARNEIPGLLAYRDGLPVGWVSLGPRTIFGRVQRSPLFKPIDDQDVWSVVCFFIPAEFRRQGIGKRLLAAAEQYARGQGASILEAYPVDTRGKYWPEGGSAIFWGTQSFFEKAGFKVVARRKDRRPMMRKKLEN